MTWWWRRLLWMSFWLRWKAPIEFFAVAQATVIAVWSIISRNLIWSCYMLFPGIRTWFANSAWNLGRQCKISPRFRHHFFKLSYQMFPTTTAPASNPPPVTTSSAKYIVLPSSVSFLVVRRWWLFVRKMRWKWWPWSAPWKPHWTMGHRRTAIGSLTCGYCNQTSR